jgi:DNA-binding transcriptional MerR regulator/quercetin dioxygenase-like cupin family protein
MLHNSESRLMGETMPYTVKQLARLSGISVRTLHFYDETGLLKPAFHGTNGYRFYEEPQLLMLQQILFYRELGFDLKQIKQIVSRPDFDKLAALQSHRDVLEEALTRTRTLLQTIDSTMTHLLGTKQMDNDELFAGFRVSAGDNRFNEDLRLAGEPADCKVSAEDTDCEMSVFEFTGRGGGPLHLHKDQSEWIYVLAGELTIVVGDKRHHLTTSESFFVPPRVGHSWAALNNEPCRILNIYQPAGTIEKFFRKIGAYETSTQLHQNVPFEQLCALFNEHGMDIVGPPVVGEWTIDEEGRVVQTG